MAGFGFNNRARAANDMRGGGMGLGLGRPRMETSEYRPGDRDPKLDAEPEMGQDDQYGPPGEMVGDDEANEPMMGDEPEGGMGDGWDDNERAFRDQVEQDQDSELYAKMQEWKRKWTGRAKEFGLDESQAMRVLDSLGDFDAQAPEDPGYGQDDGY